MVQVNLDDILKELDIDVDVDDVVAMVRKELEEDQAAAELEAEAARKAAEKEELRGFPGKRGRRGKQSDPGKPGAPGKPGEPGAPGKPGKPGEDGDPGKPGEPGKEGDPGDDGVGIAKAYVDENYHLIIKLTSGKLLDTGYVRGPVNLTSKGGRVTGAAGGAGGGGVSYDLATDGMPGLAQLATQEEVDAGTSTNRVVTPATLRNTDVARIKFGTVNLIIGETTFVHGLELSDRNSFLVSAKVNNSSVNLDVDSVDTNTITLTSLVAASNVKITVTGA